jgi:hypothetical protein
MLGMAPSSTSSRQQRQLRRQQMQQIAQRQQHGAQRPAHVARERLAAVTADSSRQVPMPNTRH